MTVLSSVQCNMFRLLSDSGRDVNKNAELKQKEKKGVSELCLSLVCVWRTSVACPFASHVCRTGPGLALCITQAASVSGS
jgi:hypothetical protein